VSENSDNIDDLLVKVMLGESTGEELRLVQDWITVSPANERYFEDFKRIWEESRKLAVQSTVNADAAWGSFKERVKGAGVDEAGQVQVGAVGGEAEPGTAGTGHVSEAERSLGGALVIDRGEAPVRGMRLGRHAGWMRVAAILLVVVAGGWFYYTYSYTPNLFLSVNSGAQVLSDTLPEGSVVTLNKQSFIRYRRRFAGDTRSVDMDGEVFFNVAPDKNKPFTVNTNGVTITVLGTSFNVSNKMGATEVIVETGLVEISKNGQTVRVSAHEKAVIGKDNSRPVKGDNTDALYNYYRTNTFECNGTPLWRLVEKLNEVYKVHIVIGNNRLRELPLTTTFFDVSLDQILNVVAKTFAITVERTGSEIILK
jgi:ferric-dicitrate binding protein FerR (iron transport regulator)